MAGPSPSSSHIMDCEEFEDIFVEKAFCGGRQERDSARFSRWRSPLSLLKSHSDPQPSDPFSFDLGSPPKISPRGTITIWDADQLLEQTEALSPDLQALRDIATMRGENSSSQTSDIDGSSHWAWPISQRSSMSNASSPFVQSPIDDYVEASLSSGNNSPGANTIWDADLPPERSSNAPSSCRPLKFEALFTPTSADFLSLQAWAPSPESRSPMSMEKFSPTSVRALSWMNTGGISASSDDSETITIWEHDLSSDQSSKPSLESLSQKDSSSSSSGPIGGFSFLGAAPTMEEYSFKRKDEIDMSSEEASILSMGNSSPLSLRSSTYSLYDLSVLSGGSSIDSMGKYSFDDKWWVEGFVAAMEKERAEAANEEDKEDLPVLIPGVPEPSPQKAPSTINEDQDTADILRQVAERLATVTVPSPAVSSPGITKPRDRKPKLTIVTDFSPQAIHSKSESRSENEEFQTALSTPEEEYFTPPQSPVRSTSALPNLAVRRKRPQLTIITKFSPVFPTASIPSTPTTNGNYYTSSDSSSASIPSTPKTIEDYYTPIQSPSSTQRPSIRFATRPSRALNSKQAAYPKEYYPRANKRKITCLMDTPSTTKNKRLKFDDPISRPTQPHTAEEHFELSGATRSSSGLPIADGPQSPLSSRESDAQLHLESTTQAQANVVVSLWKAAVTVLMLTISYPAMQSVADGTEYRSLFFGNLLGWDGKRGVRMGAHDL